MKSDLPRKHPSPFFISQRFKWRQPPSGWNRSRIRHIFTTTWFFAFFLAAPVQAHRTSSEVVDTCIITVGEERVHFTAYTPTFTQSEEFCKAIPNIGPTNLVFDYEGRELRNMTVEFEITKEPDGTRVFYQEPKKIVTGTVNGVVDFAQFGAGSYLAHITLVNNNERLDTHLPFLVGVEPEPEGFFGDGLLSKWLLILTLVVATCYFLILLYRGKREDAPS